MLLGWIAGTMALTDPAVVTHLPGIPQTDLMKYVWGIVGALIVYALGKLMARRKTQPEEAAKA